MSRRILLHISQSLLLSLSLSLSHTHFLFRSRVCENTLRVHRSRIERSIHVLGIEHTNKDNWIGAEQTKNATENPLNTASALNVLLNHSSPSMTKITATARRTALTGSNHDRTRSKIGILRLFWKTDTKTMDTKTRNSLTTTSSSQSQSIPRGETSGAVLTITNLRLSRGVNDLLLPSEHCVRVEPNECCGIIGPNGSGKSTLLKVITGKIENYRGLLSRVDVFVRFSFKCILGEDCV